MEEETKTEVSSETTTTDTPAVEETATETPKVDVTAMPAAETAAAATTAKKGGPNIVVILLIILILIGAGIIVLLIVKPFDKKDDKTTTTTAALVDAKVTIKFDTDGGDAIEDMEVTKGEKVDLPTPTKKGYTFVEWKDDKDVVMNTTVTFEENTTLKAVWKEVTPETKTMKITFDSKGGTSVSAMTLECTNDTVTIKSFPKNPTKTNYDFVAWVDKNGKAILAGAKLTCADIKLEAEWAKKEVTPTPEPTPTKTYTCPDGYTLKDTNKCVITTSKEDTCKSGWKLHNGECVNPNSPNPEGTRGCPQINLSGYGMVDGDYYSAGAGYCLYVELTSYKGNKTGCDNASGEHMWFNPNSGCYRKYTMNQYIMKCANDEKKFGNQELAPGNGGGCYQVAQPTKKCPDGYTSESAYGECAKIVAATEQ